MSRDMAGDGWIEDLIADVHKQAERHSVSFEYFMTRLLDEYLLPLTTSEEAQE